MTLEEFRKKRWMHSELIEFRPHRMEGVVIECMLLAVDFEQYLFKLEPFDKEIYETKSFWCRVEYCKRPAPKLKIKK